MSREKDFFDQQVASLGSLASIYERVDWDKDCFSNLNKDHLLRSEFILIVSAFDNYLHNIVRRKITESFFSTAPLPDKMNLEMPVRIFQELMGGTDDTDTDARTETRRQLFDSALRKQLSESSFQSPRSVEYAAGLLQIVQLWKTVASAMNVAAHTNSYTPENVRNQLALIVQRRNQIAHEADIVPGSLEMREIDTQTVSDCRIFLTRLADSIDNQV